MTCSYQNGEEEGADGCKEGNLTGMAAEQLLGYLYQPVHAARGLQDAGTCHGGHNDVDDIGGRSAWFQTVVEDEDG